MVYSSAPVAAPMQPMQYSTTYDMTPPQSVGYEAPQQFYYYGNDSFASAPPTPPPAAPCSCAECMPGLVALPLSSSPEESFSGSVSGESTPPGTVLSTSITQYVHDPYSMEPLSIGQPADPVQLTPEVVDIIPATTPPPMNITMDWAVEMEFKHGRRETFTMSAGFGEEPIMGSAYIVEGDRGFDLAVALSCVGVDEVDRTSDKRKGPMKKVVREATQQEVEYHAKALTAEEQPTVEAMNSILRSNGITHVHVYASSYQLDKKKLSFFYESRQRQPDFRPILSECYAQWKCRIWFTTVPRRHRKDL